MIRIILFSLFLFLVAACEKILHPEEISIGKIESYEELVSATEGVYGKLANAFGSPHKLGLGFYAANLKGDDLNWVYPSYNEYYGGDQCANYDNYRFNYNQQIYDGWQAFYKVIASANNIINQYDNFLNQEQPTHEILGEVFLLRAYCYFRLTRTCGRVPLVDNIEVSYTLPKPSFLEIYEFIERDLKLAGELLPGNNNKARIPFVTPHRGVVKAILAEVYLSWAGYPVKDISKYTLAAREAGEVIDSADYFGFSLLDDFAHLWDQAHFYNNESVFTLYFANPLYSTKAIEINNVGIHFSGDFFPPDWIPSVISINPKTTIFLTFFPTEVNFYNNYPRGYRKEITFFTTIYVPNNDPYYPQIDTGYIHIDNVNTCNRIGYRKFIFEPYEVPDTQYPEYQQGLPLKLYFGNPKVYFFRYTHTLLTCAEALVRSGQLNEQAYECVNRIKRRAHNVDYYSPSVYDLQPGLSPEEFADSVVWERAWELCGEPEGRWFDLVRLEKVEDLPQLRHPQEGGPPEYPVTKDSYFFPPPADDVNLNPNLGSE
jgi:hypothetical protein